MQHDRDVGVHVVNSRGQLETRAAMQPAVLGILDVRDHTEDVLSIGREVVPGFLVRFGQQDLGAYPVTKHLLRQVESLGDQVLHVIDQFRVDHRQER